MVNGVLNPEAARRLRTNIASSLGELKLEPKTQDRIVGKIADAAEADIKTTLTKTGNAEALGAFEAGDNLWHKQGFAARNVLNHIFGKNAGDILKAAPEEGWGADLEPEAAVAAITKFAGKNHRVLVGLLDKLDEPTRATVRATVAYNLGRNLKSGEFDPALFIKQLNAIPPRTQRALFGAEAQGALNDLKSVSGLFTAPVGKGDTSSWWVRRLKISLAMGAAAGLVGATGGLGIPAAAGTAATVMALKGVVTDPFVSRMLTNPGAAKRLAALARAGNPSTRKARLRDLTTFANRIPELRDGVNAFAAHLMGKVANKEPVLSLGGEKEDKAPAEPAPEEAEPSPSSGASLGERNNNPGNLIDDSNFTKSQPGYVGRGEKGFAQFDTPEAGIAAQERLLGNSYLAKGVNTPNLIVEKYNPRKDPRNTPETMANYKAYIAKKLGIGIDDEIPVERLHELAAAMRKFETGAR
jgi:hypothetical protein